MTNTPNTVYRLESRYRAALRELAARNKEQDMSTATTKSRATFLTDLPGERAKVYVTSRGLRLGVRGKVTPPADLVTNLDKGDARRIRKALRRAGRTDLVLASLSS